MSELDLLNENPAIWQDSRADNSKKFDSVFDNSDHIPSLPTWQAARLARVHHISIPHANLICDLLGGVSHG